MALVGDTGQGATLTFATSSLSLLIASIKMGEESIDMLPVNLLASTGFEKLKASDLKKVGEITVMCVHNTTLDLPTIGGAPETMTISSPLRTGEATAANYAGTGVFKARKLPDMELGAIQMFEFKIQYDGDTGPAYTKAVAS